MIVLGGVFGSYQRSSNSRFSLIFLETKLPLLFIVTLRKMMGGDFVFIGTLSFSFQETSNPYCPGINFFFCSRLFFHFWDVAAHKPCLNRQASPYSFSFFWCLVITNAFFAHRRHHSNALINIHLLEQGWGTLLANIMIVLFKSYALMYFSVNESHHST